MKLTWTGTAAAGWYSGCGRFLVGDQIGSGGLPSERWRLYDRAKGQNTYHPSAAAARRAAQGIVREEHRRPV